MTFTGNASGSFSGPGQAMPCAVVPVVNVDANTNIPDIQIYDENANGTVSSGTISSDVETETALNGTNINYYTNININLPWGWENAHYNASQSVQNGSLTVTRSVTTVVKLLTGGAANSTLKNLIGFSANAQQVAPQFVQNQCTWPDPLSISANCMTNGPVSIQTNWYLILPDNANLVITLPISLSDYTFKVTPTKYHSYFDIFVEPASLSPLETGHVFCRFRTDAPTNALNYISPSLTGLLNQCEGFYPDVNDDPEGHTGRVQPDNSTSYYFARTFYIGLPGLLNGLSYIYAVQQDPPDYNLGFYDCINFATAAGWDAGIDKMSILDVPGVVSGDVARNLSSWYPGPWTNNTTIYYP